MLGPRNAKVPFPAYWWVGSGHETTMYAHAYNKHHVRRCQSRLRSLLWISVPIFPRACAIVSIVLRYRRANALLVAVELDCGSVTTKAVLYISKDIESPKWVDSGMITDLLAK